MLIVDNVLLPPQLLTLTFACDYNVCGGVCCKVPGDGAPVLPEERIRLDHYRRKILAAVPDDARKFLKNRNLCVSSGDNRWFTNCLPDGKCVFARTVNGVISCVLENIASGLVSGDSLRPVSCRLFPLRVRSWGGFVILDYEEWVECRHAWGADVKLLDFCREGLVLRFGERWMQKLDALRKERESLGGS